MLNVSKEAADALRPFTEEEGKPSNIRVVLQGYG